VTAALALVTAVADDGSPVAMWSAGDGADALHMTRERARALTDRTRAAIVEAGANLIELRAGSAHLALGYMHWHEYVEREFGELMVWRLVRDRVERVAERQALVASMTLAGYTVAEQREAIGAAQGTVHADQRSLGLVPDRPLPTVVDEPEPVDPFRGLSPRWEVLARVAAQDDRGLTIGECDAELGKPSGTAVGALSKLTARGWLSKGGFDERRQNQRPYRITDAGRARLAEVLAARDAAESD
jgi:hypothetical protein